MSILKFCDSKFPSSSTLRCSKFLRLALCSTQAFVAVEAALTLLSAWRSSNSKSTTRNGVENCSFKTGSRRQSRKKPILKHFLKGFFKGKLQAPKLRKSADKSLSQPGCSHSNTIYAVQLQKTIVLRMQPRHRATLTQPLQCDLQRLSCKTQKNYAQRCQKLQLQNRISTPKQKKDDFEAFFKRSHVWLQPALFQILPGSLHICLLTIFTHLFLNYLYTSVYYITAWCMGTHSYFSSKEGWNMAHLSVSSESDGEVEDWVIVIVGYILGYSWGLGQRRFETSISPLIWEEQTEIPQHIIDYLEVGKLFLKLKSTGKAPIFNLICFQNPETQVHQATAFTGLQKWFSSWRGKAFTYASDCDTAALRLWNAYPK